MAFRRLRSILFLLFLLVLLFTGAVFLVHFLFYQPSVQRYLLQQLSNRVGYHIHAEQIGLLFWKGVGIQAQNFRITTTEDAQALAASRVRITFSLRELVRGRIVPTDLALEEPEIELDLHGGPWAAGFENKPPALEDSPLKALAAFPSVTVDGALITVKGMPLKSRDLFVRLSRKSQDDATFQVVLNGKLDYQGDEVPLSAQGDIAWDPASGPSARLKLKLLKIPLWHIRLPDLPVKKGTADMEATVSGNLRGDMSAQGSIVINDLNFAIIDDADRKDFSFDRLLFPFDASYSNDAARMPSFQVKGPGFTLNGAATLDFKDRSDPHLSLRVTSNGMPVETFRRIFPSSLLPQWIETRLFPIFSGGQVRVDHFSLDGTLGQIKDLDVAKNARTLRLKLTCTDLTAFKDAGGVPVEGVCGMMSIENGGLRTSGIRGHFRSSDIEEGTLRVNSLYEHSPSILVTAAGSARMEDLLMQKELTLIPDEVRRQLDRFSSATGKIQGTLEVGYEKDWPRPKLLKGNLTFRECALASSAGLIFPVFVKEGELIVDGETGRRFSVKGRWGRSSVDASGQLGRSWETGEARIVAQADLVELLGHFQPDLHSAIFFRRPVTCRLGLVKEEKRWRFQGDLDLKDISLETASMTIEPFDVQGNLSFSGDIDPGERFSISKLTCTAGESAFRLSGVYHFGEGRFDHKVSGQKIRLRDLGVHFKKGNVTGKGMLTLDAAVQGYWTRPEMTRVTGKASGRDLFFAAQAFPHPIDHCSFDLQFDETSLSIASLDLKLGDSPFHMTGKLKGWDGMRGNLMVQSDDLDLSSLLSPELITLFKAPTDPEPATGSEPNPAPGQWQEDVRRFMDHSDIDMDIRASRGQWQGFKYGPLSMECALRSGNLYINRFSAAWEHGKMQLRGYVKGGKQPDMLFSAYMDMTRQPFTEFPPALDFLTSRAEGMLTLEALLFAQGRDWKSIVSSLSGSVNVMVQKGMFKKSNIFIKILDFLSVKGVFERRPSDLPKGGLYFESIGGHIELDKGIAKTEDMTMESPVFNAVAIGEADLTKAQIDAEVGVHPFGTVDSLLSKVPVVGYLLTGDQKALYIEYFKVDGPLDDPNVQYIPVKSLSKGTTRFLTRLLFYPKRVFERISDAAKKFEGKGYPLPEEVGGPESDMGGVGVMKNEELKK